MNEDLLPIKMDLTKAEINLLRGAVSDLGEEDPECVRLQLKLANAILDATAPSKGQED